MDISNIIASSQAGQGPQASSTAGKNQLGKDGFLQLLVAQMKNQDPINPMDGTEFASQLAQFNSVEQLINVNDGIQQLAQSQNAMSNGLSNTLAASLTGKNVRAISNNVSVQTGEESTIPYRLNNTASSVEITITDAAGNTVRTQQLENIPEGENSWAWDGKSNDGSSVPEGTYNIEISAKNGDSDVQALTYQEGIAEKVRYSEKGVELIVNGVAIPLGDVEEIGV
jgi:flagellar basal-body rod modification protein FlgD